MKQKNIVIPIPAVIVGINYFKTEDARLYGCINDGITVENIAKQQYGFQDKDIVFLRDDSDEYENQPTKQNIIKALEEVVYDSVNLKHIWFHYSGHGASTFDQSGDERDGMDEFLIPSDFETNGVILDDLLYDIICQAKCPVFITIDSCHSGTMIDLTYSFDITSYGLTRTVENKRPIANKHIYMLSGCQDNQTSDDVRYDTKAEGAFTRALADSLSLHHYEPSLVELFASIRATLQKRGHTQRTLLSCSNSLPYMKMSKH